MKPTLLELAAGRLSVVFAKLGDRFAHEVVWDSAAGGALMLAQSVEGIGNDAQLPSPALQMVELEERGAVGPVLLGLGMAGSCHWSLSVSQSGSERLRFDVACRTSEEQPAVCSTYRCTSLNPALRFRALDGAVLAAVEVAPAEGAVCEQVGGLSPACWEVRAVEVPATSARPGNRTVRWMYEVWAEADEAKTSFEVHGGAPTQRPPA